MTNTELLTEICVQFRRTADLIEEYVGQMKSAVNSDEAEGGAFFQGELSDTVKGGEGSVGVIVIDDGLILTGTRNGDTESGLICGPGGHIESGETPEQAAVREMREEFGITPKELIPLDRGPVEADTNFSPHIFLCIEYEGEVKCEDGEMCEPRFLSHEQIDNLGDKLFKPFADSILLLFSVLFVDEINSDGGAGSGNHNHEGVPGQIGGSAPSAKTFNNKISESYKVGVYTKVQSAIRECLHDAPIGTKVTSKGTTYTKVENNKYEYEFMPGKKFTVTENCVANGADCVNPKNAPIFEEIKSEDIAAKKIENGEILLNVSKYSGRTDFPEGNVPYENMVKKKQEFAKNLKKGGSEAEITDEEVERLVGAVKHYNLGGQCQEILSAQDPDTYGFLRSGMSDERKAWAAAQAEAIERFIELSDKVETPIYRGMGFNTLYNENAEKSMKFLNSLKMGETIDFGHISSWTSGRGTAKSYADVVSAEYEDGENYSILMTVKNPKSTVSLSGINPEGECISPKSAKYKVSCVKTSYDKEDNCHYYDVELEEI